MATTTRHKNADSEFHRYRRAKVIDDVRVAFPHVLVCLGRVQRIARGEWEFSYRTFYWRGRAVGANDATATGWSAFLRQQGVAGYAGQDVAAPTEFAFPA